MRIKTLALLGLFTMPALAQVPEAKPDEGQLGEFVVTGTQVEQVTRLAVLPSFSPDLEDVILRSVVRHDFELSGMFDVLADAKAPAGSYYFDDPIDVDAWKKVGAEVIVKVAARRKSPDRIEVYGLAYFLETGKEPVFERRLEVKPEELRVTAHRVTDALLGAITGRPGSFASHLAFATRWGAAHRVFTMDADGESLVAVTGTEATAIAPHFARDGRLFYVESENYAPFRVKRWENGQSLPVALPMRTSIYNAVLSLDGRRMALAVAEAGRSVVYLGNADGTGMQPQSTTEIAVAPAFSPSGKLAWVGGGPRNGGQRIYVDGKPISPAGFSAASPTFCDTEDGVRIVYSVSVGSERQDLILSDEHGRGMTRLTQGQGSNYAPACSPDGRLLAFTSTRRGGEGLYFMSLKRFTTQRVNGQRPDSLSWATLPGPALLPAPRPAPKAAPKAPPPAASAVTVTAPVASGRAPTTAPVASGRAPTTAPVASTGSKTPTAPQKSNRR